ncbi:MAG: hypothetical protein Q7T87_01465 [Polaromonas sp.]|nr:hypothetical protein [Polaromonas sp.]
MNRNSFTRLGSGLGSASSNKLDLVCEKLLKRLTIMRMGRDRMALPAETLVQPPSPLIAPALQIGGYSHVTAPDSAEEPSRRNVQVLAGIKQHASRTTPCRQLMSHAPAPDTQKKAAPVMNRYSFQKNTRQRALLRRPLAF